MVCSDREESDDGDGTWGNYMYMTPDHKADEVTALAHLRVHPDMLEYAPHCIRDTFHIVMEVVKKDGMCVRYASEQMRCHERIAKAAVTQNGGALRYLSYFIRMKWDIVHEAMTSNPGQAYQHLPDLTYFNKLEYVSSALKANGYNLQYVPPHVADLPDLVLLAVMDAPGAIRHASTRLKNDVSFLVSAVEANPQVFVWLPFDMQSNKEIQRATKKEN
jgi:hypothetical protein